MTAEKRLEGAGVGANTGKINTVKAEVIIGQLLANAAGLKYGSVSVSVKLHDERLVEVSYSKVEHTRDADNPIFDNE